MPNRSQLAFLAALVSVFSSLVFLFHLAKSKLSEAGYDFSEFLLTGRLNQRETMHTSNSPIPSQTASLLDLKNSAGGAALAVAAITIVLYWRLSSTKRQPVLKPSEWQEFPLKEKIVISPNTAIYRFQLPRPDDVLGLPIGQHVSVSAEISGKVITRSYTPTSSDDDLGYFDLLVKSYEKGNISRYLALIKIGDKVRIKGPKGQFKYSSILARHMGMIAGGTGITPMLQIINAALKNATDKTKLSLIYANVNFEDILLKEELDNLAAKYPHRFTVYYVLNNPPEGWKGGVGFVSKEQIESHMPPASSDIKVLMCGPPPMMTAMKKHLNELNYPAPNTISKLVDQVFLF